ncbi:hypothetical protein HYALB_00004766 [Hymenoscyphus albidus]|uniref:Uncharacterized protein n=1 Tax=Hymenoscyphus albidus TaxID=595503 RepID=A0A9N9Q5H6_9HELO|nr:hypothetical protein HYALB_00004766 [Hymenoscyphus albidus]
MATIQDQVPPSLHERADEIHKPPTLTASSHGQISKGQEKRKRFLEAFVFPCSDIRTFPEEDSTSGLKTSQ